MYRNTYVEVNLKNIKYNVETLIKKYNCYKYFFGVVKADGYGHNDIKVAKTIIEAGCNYLAVATLEEAINIRREIKNIPILCLGIIPSKYINECIQNNITITISNTNQLNEILLKDCKNLKVHVKIDTGMNRLGINNKCDFNLAFQNIKKSNLILEGLYTHIHSPLNKETTKIQYSKFEEITQDINLSEIPIIHMGASDSTIQFPKLQYSNGCRFGKAMYGIMQSENLSLLPTFSLYSEVIQINEVHNDTVGYDGAYRVNGKEKIAIVPIGFSDGINRKNTGRNVYINDKEYKIVGNICMDMLFVKVDDTVMVGDKVVLIKDIHHIKEIAKYLDTIPSEVICSVNKRVPRIYV